MITSLEDEIENENENEHGDLDNEGEPHPDVSCIEYSKKKVVILMDLKKRKTGVVYRSWAPILFMIM